MTIAVRASLEFLLDINQGDSQPLRSLDELHVSVHDEADLTCLDTYTKELAGQIAFHDLDVVGDT